VGTDEAIAERLQVRRRCGCLSGAVVAAVRHLSPLEGTRAQFPRRHPL